MQYGDGVVIRKRCENVMREQDHGLSNSESLGRNYGSDIQAGMAGQFQWSRQEDR